MERPLHLSHVMLIHFSTPRLPRALALLGLDHVGICGSRILREDELTDLAVLVRGFNHWIRHIGIFAQEVGNCTVGYDYDLEGYC